MYCNIEIKFYNAEEGESPSVLNSGLVRLNLARFPKDEFLSMVAAAVKSCFENASGGEPKDVSLMESSFFDEMPYCEACCTDLTDVDMVGTGDGGIKPKHETLTDDDEPDGGAWCVACMNKPELQGERDE